MLFAPPTQVLRPTALQNYSGMHTIALGPQVGVLRHTAIHAKIHEHSAEWAEMSSSPQSQVVGCEVNTWSGLTLTCSFEKTFCTGREAVVEVSAEEVCMKPIQPCTRTLADTLVGEGYWFAARSWLDFTKQPGAASHGENRR
jgi:hypothetical protein